MLCAAVIVTGPRLDLPRREHLLRLHDGAFAMHPFRLNRVQPRTRSAGGTRAAAPPPSRLVRRLCSLSQARTRRLMCQEALSQTSSNACLPSPPTPHRPKPNSPSSPGSPAGRPQNAAASRRCRPATARSKPCRLGVRVLLADRQLLQTQRVRRPGVQVGLSPAAPPALVLEGEHPVRVGGSQTNQPVARFFSCA